MILVADIGNSNTVCGVFEGQNLLKTYRFRTEIDITADELRVLLNGLLHLDGLELGAIKALVVASVVPPLLIVWQEFAARLNKEFCVAKPLDLGIPIELRYPSEVGIDRVLNALAAWHRYRQPLIIVDYGTATTFDCVSAKGAYLGGAIAPGILSAAENLFRKTSMLPRIELSSPPEEVIGRDTFAALKSGLLYGFAALTDGMVSRLAAEFPEKPRIIATGGLAPLMAQISLTIERIEPYLTLKGLNIFYERCRHKQNFTSPTY